MGHLGILPQSVKGKFKYKGKKISERKKEYLMKQYCYKKRCVFYCIGVH